jgi:hypothetical protein
MLFESLTVEALVKYPRKTQSAIAFTLTEAAVNAPALRPITTLFDPSCKDVAA